MTQNTANRPLASAFCMLFAMSIIGGIDNLIVILAQDIGLWQFHFFRALMAVPLVIALPLLGLGTLWPLRTWAVALRSGFVGISMLLYFSSLALMPIAQALAGLFTSPIFILLIKWLYYREPIQSVRIVAVILGFSGILMVLRPDAESLTWLTLLPVAAGFFYALGALATRSLCVGESTVALLAGMWVMLGLMGAAGLVLLTILPENNISGADGFVSRGWIWPLSQSIILIMIQAVFSVIGVFFIIKSYQIGDVSHASIFEYSVMIFGPFYAYLIFDQTLTILQIIGIGFIIIAGTVLAFGIRLKG
ncbi:MAG: DMT family transporter [Aestuariivita sp.]|nr:DMT family transporter [Aestuariivita sp.]